MGPNSKQAIAGATRAAEIANAADHHDRHAMAYALGLAHIAESDAIDAEREGEADAEAAMQKADAACDAAIAAIERHGWDADDATDHAGYEEAMDE